MFAARAELIASAAAIAAGVIAACAHGVDPEGPPNAEENHGGSPSAGGGGVADGPTSGTGNSASGPSAGGGGMGNGGDEGGGGMGGGSTTTSTGAGGAGTLRAQYLTANTMSADAEMKPHLKVFNDGSSTVNLSDVTVRYYFTLEPGGALVFYCDYAFLGCGSITHAFSTTSGTDADHYLEVSFTSGTLGPGQDTGEIQTRFNTSDYAAQNELNDYSYDVTLTSFTDWGNVTVYDGGVLVWGAEP